MGAARDTQEESIMATIGTFTKSGDGFTGSVKTLTLNVKATIRPAERENDRAPDYRIFAGATVMRSAGLCGAVCRERLFSALCRPWYSA